jgi:hypothetical protein
MFDDVDPAVRAWSARTGHAVFTKYRDDEVRSWSVVDPDGTKYQMWLGVPKDGRISVHAWDFGRRQWVTECALADVESALDDALDQVNGWSAEGS